MGLTSILTIALSLFIWQVEAQSILRRGLNDLGNNSIHWIALGDWGASENYIGYEQKNVVNVYGAYSNQASLAKAMGEWASTTSPAPSFVLALGDNFYPKGVQSVHDPQWKLVWEDIYLRDYMGLRVPWHPVLGEHDYGYGMTGAYAQIEKTFVNVIDRSEWQSQSINRNVSLWQFPSRTYAKTMPIPGGAGSVRIIFIDTTILSPNASDCCNCCNEQGGVSAKEQQELISEQLASIESMLQGSDEDPPTWLLVVGHYPLYSSGRHGDIDDLAEHLKPLLEKYKVHTYLSGHDHISEHLQSNGIEYFVCGAGALTGSLGNRSSAAHMVWSGVGYNAFATFEATRNYLRVQYLDSQGVVKYKYTLTNPRYRGSFISILSPTMQMLEVVLFLCGILFIAIAAVFIVSDRETNINVPKRIAAIIARSQDKLNSSYSSSSSFSSLCNPLTVAADSSSSGFLADVIEPKRASSCAGSVSPIKSPSHFIPIGVNGDWSSRGVLDISCSDISLLTVESELREIDKGTCGSGPIRLSPPRGGGACGEPSGDVRNEAVGTAAVSSSVSFVSMNKVGNCSPSIRLMAMQHSHRKIKSAFT